MIFAISVFLINIYLPDGLKIMWNLINVLQFVGFMQLWQIKLPTLCSILVKNLKTFVLFEFFDAK